MVYLMNEGGAKHIIKRSIFHLLTASVVCAVCIHLFQFNAGVTLFIVFLGSIINEYFDIRRGQPLHKMPIDIMVWISSAIAYLYLMGEL